MKFKKQSFWYKVTSSAQCLNETNLSFLLPIGGKMTLNWWRISIPAWPFFSTTCLVSWIVALSSPSFAPIPRRSRLKRHRQWIRSSYGIYSSTLLGLFAAMSITWLLIYPLRTRRRPQWRLIYIRVLHLQRPLFEAMTVNLRLFLIWRKKHIGRN